MLERIGCYIQREKQPGSLYSVHAPRRILDSAALESRTPSAGGLLAAGALLLTRDTASQAFGVPPPTAALK